LKKAFGKRRFEERYENKLELLATKTKELGNEVAKNLDKMKLLWE